MKIGIFPGSFNPIHIGHLAIANYIAEFERFDEVWFLITPQNPIKGKENILPELFRLELIEKAITGYEKFKPCTIEWTLPKPTYTITTLQKLKIMYTEHQFELIIGSDNWDTFHRWKDYQRILNNFKVLVYPRRGSHKTYINHPNVRMCKAPMFEVSSTFIRKNLTEGKDVRFFLPSGTYEILKETKAFEVTKVDLEE
jgi:nicotinate-nucleotide adenylyltransferase